MKTPKPLPKEGDKFVYEFLDRMQYLRVVHVDEEDVCYQTLVDPLLILGENHPVFWGSKMEWLSILLWRRRLGKRLHPLPENWEYTRALPDKHFTGAEWELVQKAALALPSHVCKGHHDEACEDYTDKRQKPLQFLGARC